MSGRRRFLADVGILQVSGGLSVICQLLASIALAKILGAQGQGLWISAVSLQGLGSCLFGVGVPQSSTSQIAAALARGQHDKLTSWIAFCVKVQCLFGLAVCSVGALVFPWAAERFLEHRELGVLAWLLCLGVLIDIPREVVRIALQGTRRMLFLGRVESGFELVRLFLVVLGAISIGGPQGVVCGSLGASAVGSLLALAQYRMACKEPGSPLPDVRLVLSQVRAVPMRSGLRQGLRISLIKNAHTLFLSILPRLLIHGLAGASQVAYFHIAQRCMSLPHILSRAIGRTTLPAMAEHAGQREARGFRLLFLRTSLGGAISVNILLCCLLGLLPFLVPLFFPGDYSLPVQKFATILAIGAGLESLGMANEAFFITANRIRLLYVLSLIGALVTIPSNVWLVGHLPIWGAAWGVVVYQSWDAVSWLVIVVLFWRRRAGYDD